MTGTGHVPRLDDLPEPEHPVYPDLTRPLDLPLRERIAARFWDVLAAFDKWLYWTWGRGSEGWRRK